MTQSWIERWWDFVDQRGVVRRIVLGVAIWMTVWLTIWGMDYAYASTRTGADIAMIITAVTGPGILFCGVVFRTYIESRKPENQPGG